MVSPLGGTLAERTVVPLHPCAILSSIPGPGSHGQLVLKRRFYLKLRTAP